MKGARDGQCRALPCPALLPPFPSLTSHPWPAVIETAGSCLCQTKPSLPLALGLSSNERRWGSSSKISRCVTGWQLWDVSMAPGPFVLALPSNQGLQYASSYFIREWALFLSESLLCAKRIAGLLRYRLRGNCLILAVSLKQHLREPDVRAKHSSVLYATSYNCWVKVPR